jgi:hypothetical protein
MTVGEPRHEIRLNAETGGASGNSGPFRFELQAAAYALDSTTIDLCLSLFPWATFRKRKAAIKLHTLLTLQGNFPTVIIVSTGSVHDVNILDQLVWEAGSFCIMIAATLTSPAGIGFISAALSSSPASGKTSAAPAVIPASWTKPPACVSIRPWCSPVWMPNTIIPSRCAASAIATPKPA